MENRLWMDVANGQNFPYISRANVAVYPESHELCVAGRSVRCTRAHLRMLTLLLSNFCKTVTCEELLGVRARALNAREHNILKVQVHYLRRMLKGHRAQMEIRNIHGVGYQARPAR
jgi:DNA-binding response OmpR family regulator